MITLTLTADGNSAEFPLNARVGKYTLKLAGTFGGATVALQIKQGDSDTFATVPDGSFTGGTTQTLELAPCVGRFVVSSAGGTTSIVATINQFFAI